MVHGYLVNQATLYLLTLVTWNWQWQKEKINSSRLIRLLSRMDFQFKKTQQGITRDLLDFSQLYEGVKMSQSFESKLLKIVIFLLF